MTAVAKLASPASLDYLESLWGKYSTGEFKRETFAAMTQTDVSAHIDELRVRKQLPATEQQLAEIETLRLQVFDVNSITGEVKNPSFDPKMGTATADRVIAALARRVRIEGYAVAKQVAALHLEELIDGAEVL